MQMKSEAGKAHAIKPAIAFGIYGQDAKRLGDIAVTSKGLVWSNGKKSSKDITVKWDAFIDWMRSQNQGGQAAAAKAGKAAASSKAQAKSAKAKTGKTAKAGAALTAPRKPAPARKSASKINGRSAAVSKVPTIAAPKEKPADKTAH